jgi:hypothetical protein
LRQHFATEELELEGNKNLTDVNGQQIEIYDEKSQGKKLRSLSHSNSFQSIGDAPQMEQVNSRNAVVASTVNGSTSQSFPLFP